MKVANLKEKKIMEVANPKVEKAVRAKKTERTREFRYFQQKVNQENDKSRESNESKSNCDIKWQERKLSVVQYFFIGYYLSLIIYIHFLIIDYFIFLSQKIKFVINYG